MRKIDVASDNAGGLRRIIAIPSEKFTNLTIGDDGRRAVKVQDLDHAIDIRQEFSQGKAQENKKESDTGDIFEIDISGVIFGNSENNNELVEILISGTWVVLTEDSNLQWKIYGANRTRLVFEMKNDTGNSFSGLNARKFSFSCIDDLPSVTVEKPLL